MPGTIPRRMPAEITRKGRELAEQRRVYLVELYDSGRWKRYYTQEQLDVRMREANELVATWDRLAGQPDTLRGVAAE